jgi:hypothetical protein
MRAILAIILDLARRNRPLLLGLRQDACAAASSMTSIALSEDAGH